MVQCLNPDCLKNNPDGCKFCQKCGSKLRLAERYWAQRILGQGGFGRTFLAIDDFKPSKPPCVIKQFLPQAQGTNNIEKASELFAQEAHRLEDLGKHPQIPELLAYFTADNRQYLVQEFIDGETLQEELENNGSFTEKQIRSLLENLLTVLDFVHNQNVIHRDIKPENIIRRKGDQKLVLVDFGAAKVVSRIQGSATETIIGSAEYCAPEQSMGKPQLASDLYSLGVTCLHLLTQMSPFHLYDSTEMEWAWRDGLNGNPVSDELGKILDHLIEHKPKKRYQSAREVLNDLSRSPQSNPAPTPTPTPAIQLKSKPGIDYRRLEELLSREKWKEADHETFQKMLELSERSHKDRSLQEADLYLLLDGDLRMIDDLWIKYSNGQFGLSVQLQIYRSLTNNQTQFDPTIWNAFGERVGWRVNGRGLWYSDINFSTGAPAGHLPARIWDRWNRGGVGSFDPLLKKLIDSNL